jgi:4'-phosphopantetheinyl transferase EntD
MLARLVPDSVAWAETRDDRLDIVLFEAERVALGRAVDKRRREFITGRACARLALERLGAPVTGIPSGDHGEPLWPDRVVGSITHCHGYRGCAVAWSEDMVSLGIDAEPNEPLPDGVLAEVAHGRELEPPAGIAEGLHVDRLQFSAKEAVYKAWFPLAGRWLGFDDVELSLDPGKAEFRADLLVAGPVVEGARLTEFRGRWALEDGVICTAVVVPAGDRPRARAERLPNAP